MLEEDTEGVVVGGGVAVGVDIAVGAAVGIGVAVGTTVWVGVAVAVDAAVGIGVSVRVGVGVFSLLPPPQPGTSKISKPKTIKTNHIFLDTGNLLLSSCV